MNEVFKNSKKQLGYFHARLLAAALWVIFCFIVLIWRLIDLQGFKHSQYALQAEENRISLVPIMPTRGMITDRNGVVLANNYSAFSLEILPAKINRPLEGLINDLAQVVEITPRDRRRFQRLTQENSRFESLPIRTKLTDEEVARFSAQSFRFAGVDIVARLFRHYPMGEAGAHAIGYVGRLSQKDREELELISQENNENSVYYDERRDINNYIGSYHIGKIGIEQKYEFLLHGISGFEEIEVTARGRPVRTLSYKPAVSGTNLQLSLDIQLQQQAEQAYASRRGALVALEPATGEILAFVSSPSFNPNSFIEGIDQQSWDSLVNSPDKPLLNRPLRGIYPIGSTYKPFLALAALEKGKRKMNELFYDTGIFQLGNRIFRDQKPGGHGWIDLAKAISISCDTYFYKLAYDLGVDTIHNFMLLFGFGQLTGIDIEGEVRGVLPSTAWKRDSYRNRAQQQWYEGDTINVGIGQGYNAFTILQLAQATAILANQGKVMRPHFVTGFDPAIAKYQAVSPQFTPKQLPLNKKNIEFIRKAMVEVTKTGTARTAFAGVTYNVAGKTGTAQVFSLKKGEVYRHQELAEGMRDHALFIAFAPVENPQIVLAAIIENAGFGSASAAPLVRQILDNYLLPRLHKNTATR